MKLNEKDARPPVWVGHVVMETDRLEETEQFMRKIGMRSIVQRPDVAVLELRGGTHLVLIAKPDVVPGVIPFEASIRSVHSTSDAKRGAISLTTGLQAGANELIKSLHCSDFL